MLTTLVLAAALAQPPKDAPPKDGVLAFAVRSGYFEKNTSGLAGNATYLWLPDRNAFEGVFALAPPLLNAPRKATPLPETAFDTDGMAVVIRRGPAVIDYKVQSVTKAGDTVTVRYTTTEAKGSGAATFASPLIVSVPRAGVNKVLFVENDKEVGSATTKPPIK